MSGVTLFFFSFNLFFFLQIGGANRWRVCYQLVLPRLVSLHSPRTNNLTFDMLPIPSERLLSQGGRKTHRMMDIAIGNINGHKAGGVKI